MHAAAFFLSRNRRVYHQWSAKFVCYFRLTLSSAKTRQSLRICLLPRAVDAGILPPRRENPPKFRVSVHP